MNKVELKVTENGYVWKVTINGNVISKRTMKRTPTGARGTKPGDVHDDLEEAALGEEVELAEAIADGDAYDIMQALSHIA